mmetsp:Transcript_12045/g.15249  ORF Transcript_12045/g.15249 Transcript_12045/m.15249 type:complete len:358 (-) Transcript_12045:371-1444(-)
MMLRNLSIALTMALASAERFNEIKIPEGHTKKHNIKSPLPHTYISADDLPQSFTWGNVDGQSFLTHSLNQHLPNYCGSCWAHGSLSSLADRIKIARKGAGGDDINLSIQFILNCGADMAGSCHGGTHTGVYELIQSVGYVPFDTCVPYVACSDESDEGFCKHVDTTCKKENICKTCNTFSAYGGFCTHIDSFPNATVAEYGMIERDVDKIMAEIFARGPVAATINAEPILDYKGGIFTDETAEKTSNHIVSIVGWGYDEESGKRHWIVRNSWGHYWGELGYFRVEMGSNILGLEDGIAWATPGIWTEINFPCTEDGKNCDGGHKFENGAVFYNDPSNDVQAVQRRLMAGRPQKNLRA